MANNGTSVNVNYMYVDNHEHKDLGTLANVAMTIIKYLLCGTLQLVIRHLEKLAVALTIRFTFTVEVVLVVLSIRTQCYTERTDG